VSSEALQYTTDFEELSKLMKKVLQLPGAVIPGRGWEHISAGPPECAALPKEAACLFYSQCTSLLRPSRVGRLLQVTPW
jgi:hypothetical protein